ncbi:MAG: substrate-binding domain-containing protein [Lachnospiraceae bacterium]|nr:substrate-binding domain-containing protein [Lachnospiraceae bacterium]
MRKVWSWGLAMLFLILQLTGCGAESAQQSGQERADDSIQIGMSFDSFVIERWIRDRDVFVSRAEELGASVNVQSANGDVQEQIEQIRYLIEKEVDVLVVVPTDCSALSAVLGEAKKAGIKVISYDRLAESADVDLYISFDNEEVGRLMGQNLVASLPAGSELFMIGGPLTDDNVKMVEEGFHSVIDKSSLNVVFLSRCENWNAEEGYDAVKSALREYPDVRGIMCGNDDIATQAFRALSEERAAGKVTLTGQDGDLMACQRVVEGTQLVTVYKPLEDEATLAAECAVKMASGEALDIKRTINDGTYDVPYAELTPIAVTKENIDEVIIESGYHAKDEVYMNTLQQDAQARNQAGDLAVQSAE